jgi:acyl-coenzyme A thioesterase PaaI-like protein
VAKSPLKIVDDTKNKHAEEESIEKDVFLDTHEKIDNALCGDIEKLTEGRSIIKFSTNDTMRADEKGMVHSGFLFSAADYAAMTAVNMKNVLLIGSTTTFFTPIRVGDVVTFEAQVRHKDGRKRDVNVVGTVDGIKVFKGEFRTVIPENNVLNIELFNTFEEGLADSLGSRK